MILEKREESTPSTRILIQNTSTTKGRKIFTVLMYKKSHPLTN